MNVLVADDHPLVRDALCRTVQRAEAQACVHEAADFAGVQAQCAAFTPELASGAPLARAVCGFIAAFWGARLAVQFFLFDARPYLRAPILAVGYYGLTVVITYFAVVYSLAAALPRA